MNTFSYKSFLAILVSTAFTLIVMLAPSHSLDAARKAMLLCESTVIPSLFPFFVCSGILIKLGAAVLLGKLLSRVMTPVFGLSGGSSLALIMGLISGYPVGAKCVSELVLEGQIHKSEGEKLLAFCNNSGPLFILGAVGSGMLGNPRLGVILYTSHFLSSITVALLFRNIPCKITTAPSALLPPPKESFGEILTESIKNASDSVFTISGFVIVFNILISSAQHFGIVHNGISKILLCGLFEPTNGCIAAIEESVSPYITYLILSSVIGWSGISVHLQVLGIIKKAALSPKYYFGGKLLMTVISPLYTAAFLKTIPVSIPVFSEYNYNLPEIYYSSCNYFIFTVFAVFTFSAVIYLISALRKKL